MVPEKFLVYQLDRMYGDDARTSFVITVREAVDEDDKGFMPADQIVAGVGRYYKSSGWKRDRKACVRAGLTEYSVEITKSKKRTALLEEELAALQLLAKAEGAFGA